MVNIEIECKDDYSAKKFERGETLRYYLKGPQEVANEKGEIGMFDLKGRYAGLNNATELMAATVSPDNQPQNMVEKIFDLTDELYAEYNRRYNS